MSDFSLSPGLVFLSGAWNGSFSFWPGHRFISLPHRLALIGQSPLPDPSPIPVRNYHKRFFECILRPLSKSLPLAPCTLHNLTLLAAIFPKFRYV
jgi:hypothetical protein